jgi:hypothetical protein
MLKKIFLQILLTNVFVGAEVFSVPSLVLRNTSGRFFKRVSLERYPGGVKLKGLRDEGEFFLLFPIFLRAFGRRRKLFSASELLWVYVGLCFQAIIVAIWGRRLFLALNFDEELYFPLTLKPGNSHHIYNSLLRAGE